jgi:predicted component of type VI protein secretion system
MKAELVPENGDPPIPITKDLTVIGRREYCDVQIDHHSLSKRHCMVVKTDGLLIIRDLATTNGTKVKGQRIRWAALLPDDKITLGNYKLRVYLGPDDVPGPSERVRTEGKPARQAAPVGTARGLAASAKPEVPSLPRSDFPTPTPPGGVPTVSPSDDLEILDDDDSDSDSDSGDDAGWRRLIASKRDDDVVIELD